MAKESKETKVTTALDVVRQNDAPWTRLGTSLTDAKTSSEALMQAGLNWKVECVPVQVDRKNVDGYRAVRRETDKLVYGIVGEQYCPIQNDIAFKFFDEVAGMGKNKPAIYTNAGSIRDGERIFILAQLKGSLNVKGEEITKYICLLNSHNGGTAFKMFFTPVRVVCENTLRMAEARATSKFYSKHTVNFERRMELAKQTLGLSEKFYEQFGITANKLAEKQMSVKELDTFVEKLFKVDVIAQAEAVAAAADKKYEPSGKEKDAMMVRYLFEHGKGLDNSAVKHTRWAAYNAVTEFVDHYREPRETKNHSKDSNRLVYSWFTGGANLKDKALEILVAK